MIFLKAGTVRCAVQTTCHYFLLALLFFSVRFAHAQSSPVAATNLPLTIHHLTAPGIENFYQLSGRIYSGSAPEGDAAFAELKRLGIKTIITVDGAKPDAAAASRFGIKYVHLPIGYDGVPTNQALRIIKAVGQFPGPVYIHCHHGLHRGPAAAAVACMATENWTPDEAESWLRTAGTAANYAGLYRSVKNFHPPSPDALARVSNRFTDHAKTSPLVEVMVQIDGRMDNLKLIKKAGFQKPAETPELLPGNESLLLDELFKELQRSPLIKKRPADFMAKLAAAEKAANTFQSLMQVPDASRDARDNAFNEISKACAECHKAYRN